MRKQIALSVGLFALVMASACTAPTAPAAQRGRLVLGLAGQSNAVLMRPLLAEVARVSGAGDQGATPITCWGLTIDGICWRNLRTALQQDRPLDAFIWWQGESDADNPNYAAPFADLMQRIRTETQQPNLLILVVQWGPLYGGRHGGAEDAQRAWVAADAHAAFVPTLDIGFDHTGAHMSDDGYRAVSARVVGIVNARVAPSIK